MAATSKKRKPGRRQAASEQASEKHEKLILEAQAEVAEHEAKIEEARNLLASRINDACSDGVKTDDIAETLGKSRQMVYKMIRERVDKVPMSAAKSNGASKKTKSNPFAGKKATAKKPAAKKPAVKKIKKVTK